MPIIGGAGGGGSSAVGYELGYAQLTSNTNVASTTEATGTTLLSPSAIVCDGNPILVHLFLPNVKGDTATQGDTVIASLFESTTQITRLIQVPTTNTAAPFMGSYSGWYRFSPAAGSHTYTITAFAQSVTGTPQIQCGSGGTGAYPPAFVRFTKV